MSGSDFRLSYKDFNDPVKVAEEISKNSPDGLKTSRSADPRGDPTDHTLMSTSDILLRSPAMKSEQEIQSLIHQRVFGGMSAIKDEIGNIPGIGDLLPDGMIDEFGIDPSSTGGDINAIPLDGDYPPGAQQYIRNLISLAKAEIGYMESPPGSNKNKFAGTAGVANGQAWCFTEGALITTPHGLADIKDISVGDAVVSSSGNVRAVESIASRISETIVVRALGVSGTRTTSEHPYLTRRRKGNIPNDRVKTLGDYENPDWVPAGELKKGDLIALPRVSRFKLTDSESPSVELAYITGIWLGDGGKRKDRPNATMFYPGKHEKSHIDKALENAGLAYSSIERKTNQQYEVNDKRLTDALKNFGKDTYTKEVPSEVYSWGREAREALIDGYFFADGYQEETPSGVVVWSATTVSKKLAYSMASLIRQTYGQIVSINEYSKEKEGMIEGRKISQKTQYWVIRFRPYADFSSQAYSDEMYFWVPVRDVQEDEIAQVYNMSVEVDHTFIADSVAVHNCATFIMALCKEAGMPQGKLLTPGTETSYDNYNKAGRLNKDPKVGAFALFNYKSGRRVSHIAITVGVEGDKVITIDGNTSASDKGSQDNGGMVAEKVRPLSKVVAFCHPVFPEGALDSPTSSGGTLTELSPGGWTRPIGGKVNSGYGWRIDPISGKRDHHYGIDYHGNTGDPIYAAKPGKVVHSANFVGEITKGINGDYGLMVEIDHGGGYRTRYGHMSAFAVSAGVSVEAGQRIGSVGNTGRSTAPHLHFEVRKDGQPINPAEVGI